MTLPVGCLAFLKQPFSEKRLAYGLLPTLEQYETSLHALQAMVPGSLQIIVSSAGWTLAQGKAVGGRERKRSDSSFIFCHTVLSKTLGWATFSAVAGPGGRSIFLLSIDSRAFIRPSAIWAGFITVENRMWAPSGDHEAQSGKVSRNSERKVQVRCIQVT